MAWDPNSFAGLVQGDIYDGFASGHPEIYVRGDLLECSEVEGQFISYHWVDLTTLTPVTADLAAVVSGTPDYVQIVGDGGTEWTIPGYNECASPTAPLPPGGIIDGGSLTWRMPPAGDALQAHSWLDGQEFIPTAVGTSDPAHLGPYLGRPTVAYTGDPGNDAAITLWPLAELDSIELSWTGTCGASNIFPSLQVVGWNVVAGPTIPPGTVTFGAGLAGAVRD